MFLPWVSLVAQIVKNLPAMWNTGVQSLDWEDLLEKGIATHSSIIAWSISSNPYPLMALYFIIPTIIGEETQSHEVKRSV